MAAVAFIGALLLLAFLTTFALDMGRPEHKDVLKIGDYSVFGIVSALLAFYIWAVTICYFLAYFLS